MIAPVYEKDGITLYCGDCREILPRLSATDYSTLLFDPPYGIDFKSGWTNSKIAGDSDLSLRNDVLCWWGTDRAALVFGSPKSPAPEGTKARLVWHRPGSGMGNLKIPWQPDWEVVFVLGRGFSLPKRRTSLYSYSWDVFRGNSGHPHRKPVGLLVDLMTACPPGTVLDPASGSGSSLVAAKRAQRRAVGIEIKTDYCDLTIKRLEKEPVRCLNTSYCLEMCSGACGEEKA